MSHPAYDERHARKALREIEEAVEAWVLDMDARVERGELDGVHVAMAARRWPDFAGAWSTWLEHGGTLGGRKQGEL